MGEKDMDFQAFLIMWSSLGIGLWDSCEHCTSVTHLTVVILFIQSILSLPEANRRHMRDRYVLKCPPRCFCSFCCICADIILLQGLFKAVLILGSVREIVLCNIVPSSQMTRAAWVFPGMGGPSLTCLTKNTGDLMSAPGLCQTQQNSPRFNWSDSLSKGRSDRRPLVHWMSRPVTALGSVSLNLSSSINSENTSLCNIHTYTDTLV